MRMRRLARDRHFGIAPKKAARIMPGEAKGGNGPFVAGEGRRPMA